MQHILSKIDPDDLVQIQKVLIRILEQQIKTMPKSADQTEALAERFAKLQKLLDKTKNLDKEVTWEKKAYVPIYRRKKSKHQLDVENVDTIQQ